MTGNRKVLIEYRLTQARESIREAVVLKDAGMSLRSVMNRLYYAMFYTVLALLQEKEMGTSRHPGAIALFDREFVKTGEFPRAFSKALHRAYELRQKSDYMEVAEVTADEIAEIRPVAEQFVEHAATYLFRELHTMSSS
jgi:uncharacterized protein (UPF0332 family)